ncbi:MAG: hypothetical protein V4560_10605 [Bacteroidota bacterium]
MRNAFVCIMLLTRCVISASAQGPITPGCQFLGPLHFKNGKATVIVKAMYTGAARSGGYYFFKKLEKKKILDSKKYFNLAKVEGEGYFDSGSAITFVPEKCNQEFIATIAQKINFEKFKGGQTVYLTCTVYQNILPDKEQHFYVIDDVKYTKEDIPRQQNIGQLVYLGPDKLARDTGTSYFSDAGSKMMNFNCLLVITPNQLAIVETTDHKRHHFSYVKRTATKSGYIDLYKNSTEWFELKITRVIHVDKKNLSD